MTEPAPPIFIVGCQRSGTTLLRLILDSHPAISCGPETRFLRDFRHITGTSWERLSLYGFPKEYWHRKVADFFAGFQAEYASRRGKRRWADKTPLYARELDYILELFPDAQIVHVVRDGRDVVASHRATFGYWSAVKATAKWHRYVTAARSAGARVGGAQYREVRYEDLIRDTEGTLRGLLDFLGEAWDPAVLEHDKWPHDVAPRYRRYTSRRRSAGDSAPVYTSRVGGGRTEVDPLLRLLLLLQGGRVMRQLGYR